LLALFRVKAGATGLGTPLIVDPAWNPCEALEMAPHSRPMGRLSSTDLAKQTGHILCLDANYTGESWENGGGTPAAARVRVLAEKPPGKLCALGEVPVQADGSFMAEVPAGVPLGLEALDEKGRVLRRQAPMFWVCPGENRTCIGCHEPPNRAPHNHRPVAVGVSMPRLGLKQSGLVQSKSN